MNENVGKDPNELLNQVLKDKNISQEQLNSVTQQAQGVAMVEANANGIIRGGAVGSNASTDTTDLENISFSFGLEVKPNCCQNKNIPTTLTFKNIGIGAVYSDVNVTVEKVI